MRKVEFQQKMNKIINVLPETKLTELIDFASYLVDKEESEELVKLQMSSSAYQEWLSPENDIYDDLFKDDIE